MYDTQFTDQVQLLLKCLPAITAQSTLALKGGTAINLFIRDLPRLSVDIDLTYVLLKDREESYKEIQHELQLIGDRIKKTYPHFVIKKQIKQDSATKSRYLNKLFIYDKNTYIKIEPNFVMRGALFPTQKRSLKKIVQEKFDVFVDDLYLLSEADLYAGKLCAALNRQHPRDLFDVKYLLETTGITNEIRQAFVVYLACNPRPMNELLAPHLQDINSAYQREFVRMTEEAVPLDELLQTREKLITLINTALTDQERAFLISIKKGEPNFALMPFEQLEKLPGLRWKIMNVKRMTKQKHISELNKLEKVLNQ